MKENSRPIGVFDSGIGGLTVLAAVKKMLPMENFVYCADFAHMPYGNKTEGQITDYSTTIIQFMIDTFAIKLAIVACHTSSAVCGQILKNNYSIPIVDTIQPTVASVIATNPLRLGILGTERTIATEVHKKHLQMNGYTGQVTQIPCPLFVPLIEEGMSDTHAIENAIHRYCTHTTVDAFLYACTHYPFLESHIKKVIGPQLHLINPNTYIALHTKQLLSTYCLESLENTPGKTIFYSTDSTVNLEKVATPLLLSLY